MKKIIITGITGFIGQNLKKYLEPLFDIFSLKLRYKINQKIDFEADCIIHLSGIAHDLKKTKNITEYTNANYKLTKQLYNAFLESNAKVFIFISSIKAVVDFSERTISEDTIPNPSTIYGVSKLQAEKYILNNLPSFDKRVYILRPCLVHGPGIKGNLYSLYKFVINEIPYPLASFDNKRSFLSVENLCFVINQIIVNENIESGVYNIADDDKISTNDLISLIAKSTKKNILFLKVPKLLIRLLARFGDVFSLKFNTEILIKMTSDFQVSNLKIKKAINKKFPIETKKGIIDTISSMK